MKLSWLFVILLLILVAIFSVQNAAPITVHFFQLQITMSAALVIQLAALLGALVGLTVGALSRRPQKQLPAPASTPVTVEPDAPLTDPTRNTQLPP